MVRTRASRPSSSSWPIPACSWWTTAPSSRRCAGRRKRRPRLHARGERQRHRRAGAGGAGEGKDGAEVPRADPPDARRGARRSAARSPWRRWPACPMYIVHLSCDDALREGARGARPRPAGVRRDLPAVPVPLVRRLRARRLRGREVRDSRRRCATSGTRKCCGRASRRNDLQVVSTDHCPFCFKEPEEARQGRLHARSPTAARASKHRLMLRLGWRRRAGRIDVHRFVEMTSTNPARIFGLWPKKGTIAVGFRWRPRDLRSQQEPTLSAAPITCASTTTRTKAEWSTASRNGAVARRGDRRQRHVYGSAGPRPVHQAEPGPPLVA